jgi:hypothetical protein
MKVFPLPPLDVADWSFSSSFHFTNPTEYNRVFNDINNGATVK